MSRKWKILTALGVFVVAIVIARLVAPIYILGYVNRTLDGLDGYSGRVGSIELNIWRGAYAIDDVHILKDGPKDPLPFVSAERVDISVHWDALLKGSIVGEIELQQPKVNFVAEKGKESKQEDQTEKREAKRAAQGESSWQEQVKELVPLKINRIAIEDGEIHFRDPNSKPEVDVFVRKLNGHIDNLTNSDELSEELAATASFRGVALNSGELTLEGKVDPYEKQPTFELDAQLENLQAKELNDFLKAYANVDAERGRISVYTEVACAKGRFKGYVKPLIRDLRVLSWKQEEEGVIGKLWEGLVEAGSELFENDDKQQVGTRIPFRGKLENPEADVGTTVIYVLRNAFIRALSTGLDGKLEGGEEGELAKGDKK
jgi:hypothetical protein